MATGLRWTEYVRQVVCLGSPHLGADIEKGANVLGWALQRMPETRALGTLVNARSAGIKDLRFGSCTEEDWCGADADEFLPTGAARSRSSRARTTTSSRPRLPTARSVRSPETCSCGWPAPRVAAMDAGATSRSRRPTDSS